MGIVTKEDGSRIFWEGSTRRDRRLAEDRIWMTKEGDEIPFAKLDPGHLLHILLWLRRRSQEKAQDAAQKDGVRLGPGGWRARKAPEFDGLMEEARRRRGKLLEWAERIDTSDEVDEAAVKRAARRLRQDR